MQSNPRPRLTRAAFFTITMLALPLALDLEQDSWSVAGPVTETASTTLPVEIGESSSSELPIIDTPERPPVIGTPQLETVTRPRAAERQ